MARRHIPVRRDGHHWRNDIEITKGLQQGDEIVVGSYKALRTLKPEASVKVDNSAPKKPEDSQKLIGERISQEKRMPVGNNIDRLVSRRFGQLWNRNQDRGAGQSLRDGRSRCTRCAAWTWRFAGRVRGHYGASGSGKSTLMEFDRCLDSPSSGKYWLAGRLVSDLDDDELAYIRNKRLDSYFKLSTCCRVRRRCIMWSFHLFITGTPAKSGWSGAKKALERVDLVDRMNHKPNELSAASGNACDRPRRW